MVMNQYEDMVEVCWANDDSMACMGEQVEVSGRLKVSNKCSNGPKIGLETPLALLVNQISSKIGMGVHLSLMRAYM